MVHHLDDGRRRRGPPRRPCAPRRRRTRPRSTRSSGCRACPSGAGGGSGCACRRGSQRGSRKHESPRSVCASTRNASHIGAEQNHLWPVSSYSAPGPPRPSARARVVLARTSEPPCFSVIAMPKSAPVFSAAGRMRGSYAVRRRCAAPTRRPAPAGARSAGTPSRSSRWGSRGRPRPATCTKKSAARATCAPGRGSRQGSACSSCCDGRAHELVPGGMELDLVDAVAEAVVRAQHRRVRGWPDDPRRCASPPTIGAERARGAPAPSPRPRARAPRTSTRSVAKSVVALERRRLVQHLVGRRHGRRVADGRPWGDAGASKRDGAPGRSREPVLRSRSRQSSRTPPDAGGQFCTQALNAWRQACEARLRGLARLSRHWNATACAWSMHRRHRCTRAMADCFVVDLQAGDGRIELILDRLPAVADARCGTPRRSRGRGSGRRPCDLEVLATVGAARLVGRLRVDACTLGILDRSAARRDTRSRTP